MALKILLADDSMVAQSMGKKILADAGYDVTVVSNGAAALKQIPETQPDIILLDVYMPGYTGLEVCQQVKADPATARTPVLLTVGMLEPFRPEDGIRARADGVIVKPFEATDLLALVAKIAERVPADRRRVAAAQAAQPPAESAPLPEVSWQQEDAQPPARTPGPAFAAAQAMVRKAEAEMAPVANSVAHPANEPFAPAAAPVAAPADQPTAAPQAEPEPEADHSALLHGAEVAAGVAASALAGLHWRDILNGKSPEAAAEAPPQAAANVVPELEPTRLPASAEAEPAVEPALMTADLAPAAAPDGSPAAQSVAELHDEVMQAAMYGTGAAAAAATAFAASRLEDLEPTTQQQPAPATAHEPPAEPVAQAAEPAFSAVTLPELERFDPAAEAEPAVPETVATEPDLAFEPPAPVHADVPLAPESSAPAPETAAPAPPDDDFLDLEGESQPPVGAAVVSEPPSATAAEAIAPLVSTAQPTAGQSDDAGLELAERIVDRVLARLRPDLIKEVARLLN